jgi:photosystem II stability/assembly factor-like uncharacterized protein
MTIEYLKYGYGYTSYNRLWFKNEDTGFCFGPWIFRSGDGGQTWNRIMPARSILLSACFVGEKFGWAVGYSYILHTDDGGNTWREQPCPPDTNSNLRSVAFCNSAVGVTCGENGTVLRTSDGGNLWERVASPVSTGTLIDCCFFDEHDGLMLAGGVPVSAGKELTIERIRSLAFESWCEGGMLEGQALDNWLQAERDMLRGAFSASIVLKTSDGGRSWARCSDWILETLRSMSFVDRKTGWAVGVTGRVLGTKDGGKSWKTISETNVSNTAEKINFLDRKHGLVVGYDGHLGVRITDDAGLSWREPEISEHHTNRCGDIVFLNPRRGWITTANYGGGFTILTTSDGGKHWSKAGETLSNPSIG